MFCYLVTGGCGFIGSHLVDKLISLGHKVVALDNLSTGSLKNLNKRALFVFGDICNAKLVGKIMQQCDGCFHLAAVASVQESMEYWVKTNQTNVVGTITLLEAAKSINQYRPFGFVYASSAAVYGDNTNPPFKETNFLNPISPYGVDKQSCEFQAKIAGRLYGLPNVGLRFFNVYGERQSPKSAYSGVISIFLNAIKQGKDLKIYGDGEQSRDFIYVKDIVSYLCQAMDHVSPKALVFNACTGKGTSINQLAKTLIDITGVNIRIIHAPEKNGDIRISVGDNSLAKSKLSIPAYTPLAEGLIGLCENFGLYIGLKEAS